MKRAALLASAVLLLAATLLLGRLWLQRLSLPYNEQGRYYDAAFSVTYDDGAVLSYGLIALLFALFAMLALFLTIRAWRQSPEAEMDAGERLRAWWVAQGVEVRTQPVLQAEVAAVEQRYAIRLPEDFRRYFLTGGPTEEGWDGECDTNWWSVHRIRNIPDEYDGPVIDPRIGAAAGKYLFFADHMIWASAWAICCTDDADRGRVAIIGGSPERFVAESFSEFVDRYVEKDWKSLL